MASDRRDICFHPQSICFLWLMRSGRCCCWLIDSAASQHIKVCCSGKSILSPHRIDGSRWFWSASITRRDMIGVVNSLPLVVRFSLHAFVRNWVPDRCSASAPSITSGTLGTFHRNITAFFGFINDKAFHCPKRL